VVLELGLGHGRWVSASVPGCVAASRRRLEQGLGFAVRVARARWKKGCAGGCAALSRSGVVRVGPVDDGSGGRSAGERGKGKEERGG
jgi:hypothetical protein